MMNLCNGWRTIKWAHIYIVCIIAFVGRSHGGYVTDRYEEVLQHSDATGADETYGEYFSSFSRDLFFMEMYWL